MNEKTIVGRFYLNLEQWQKEEKERLLKELKKERMRLVAFDNPIFYQNLHTLLKENEKLTFDMFHTVLHITNEANDQTKNQVNELFWFTNRFLNFIQRLQKKKVTFSFKTLEKESDVIQVYSTLLEKGLVYNKKTKELIEHINKPWRKRGEMDETKQKILNHPLFIKACDDIIKEHI